jgi:hypothetical protein
MARALTPARRSWHTTSEGEGREGDGAFVGWRGPTNQVRATCCKTLVRGFRMFGVTYSVGGEVTLRDGVQKLRPLERNGGELRGSSHL